MSFLSTSPGGEDTNPDSTARTARRRSVATELVRFLGTVGVEHAFGVIGGAISPFCRALSESSIGYRHFRHEAGAAFAALETSLATDRPALVFTTTGPGLTNALTGMMAAHWDGGRVILVSASTSASHRGRLATQETGLWTMPSSMFLQGTPFDFAVTLEHPDALPGIAAEIAKGSRRREGFVAHISLPIALQSELVRPLPDLLDPLDEPLGPTRGAVSRAARLLSSGPFAIWIGYGARGAAGAILELSERTGAPVMASPRAKGIFPETHPHYIGVTGAGGHPEIDDLLTRSPPEHVLVLGTRMGESSSFWSTALVPRRAFIHVDLDPRAFGMAYPTAPCVPVQADVGAFVEALLAEMPGGPRAPWLDASLPPPRAPERPRRAPVRPEALFDAIQRKIVRGSDALVLAESGNSLCWAAHCLRFDSPHRYRGSTGFASMGHAVTGVVGAAIARQSKAIAIAGDGAMLMSSEISSAVEHAADAVWIVLNDGGYLMCEQGMTTIGWEPFGTRIPRVDFVALARAQGADGVSVDDEGSLDDALEQALSAKGPFVVDVDIDRTVRAPSGRRTKSIMQQGFTAEREER